MSYRTAATDENNRRPQFMSGDRPHERSSVTSRKCDAVMTKRYM